MKTRMHRFWLSITLAAGSLASPLSQNLMSHDLPTRWSPASISGPNADSDWNYLLDDCLDNRDTRGSTSTPLSLNRPAKGSLAADAAALAGGLDFDVLLSRNSLAKFTSEMACWANQWEQLQAQAGRAGRAELLARSSRNLVAARPAFGFPPAPVMPETDTCAFEVEYQAMQAAAERLEEKSAAKDIDEAGLTRSLAAAAELEAAAIDAIADSEPARCGGEAHEIVSLNNPANDFVPPPVDEYMSYDVDPRDAHWLGGLSKSWKLRAALSAQNAGLTDSEGAIDSEFNASATSQALGAELTAEDFAAGDSEKNRQVAEVADPVAIDESSDSTAAIYEGYVSDASEVFEAPNCNDEHFANDLGSLKHHVSDAVEWLENVSCMISAEVSGLESVSEIGSQWGRLASSAAQQSMTSYVAMGHYLDLPPAVANPTLDVVVIYTDTDGQQMSVPGSLARAWNQVDYDHIADAADAPILDPYDAAVSDLDSAAAKSAPAGALPSTASLQDLLPAVDFDELRREILSLVAAKLDSLGITCLEVADRLTNWADTQIASRDESDIR